MERLLSVSVCYQGDDKCKEGMRDDSKKAKCQLPSMFAFHGGASLSTLGLTQYIQHDNILDICTGQNGTSTVEVIGRLNFK